MLYVLAVAKCLTFFIAFLSAMQLSQAAKAVDADINAARSLIEQALSDLDKKDENSYSADELVKKELDRSALALSEEVANHAVHSDSYLGINLDDVPKADGNTLAKIRQDVAKLLEDPTQVLPEEHSEDVQLEGPFLLVSFSMSDQHLINLSKQANAAGVTLVMRGFKDNEFKATAAKIGELAELMGDETINLIIDPTLFSRFGVQRVPTLVVSESRLEHCLDEHNCSVPEFAKVTGDARLDFLLNQIQRDANNKQIKSIAQNALNKLEAIY